MTKWRKWWIAYFAATVSRDPAAIHALFVSPMLCGHSSSPRRPKLALMTLIGLPLPQSMDSWVSWHA